MKKERVYWSDLREDENWKFFLLQKGTQGNKVQVQYYPSYPQVVRFCSEPSKLKFPKGNYVL